MGSRSCGSRTLGQGALFSRLEGHLPRRLHKKSRRKAGIGSIGERLSVADVDLTASGAQFNFDNAPTLFLDSLLLSEPAVIRNPLREEGVLQLALRPNFFRARNASSDFEQPHGFSCRGLSRCNRDRHPSPYPRQGRRGLPRLPSWPGWPARLRRWERRESCRSP